MGKETNFPSLCPILDGKFFKTNINSRQCPCAGLCLTSVNYDTSLAVDALLCNIPCLQLLRELWKCSSGGDSIPAEVRISVKKLTKIYLVILHLDKNWEKGFSSWECSHACTKTNPKRLNMKEQQKKSSSPDTHFSRPLLPWMDLYPCQQNHSH